MAFWSKTTRDRETDAELADYANWLRDVREPDVDNNGLNRLRAEITVKRNDVLTGLGQRFVRPRQNKITDLRKELDVLKGMVYSWLYVAGKWDSVSALGPLTEEVNDLSMLWLSVDLIKMYERAYPQKTPRHVH